MRAYKAEMPTLPSNVHKAFQPPGLPLHEPPDLKKDLSKKRPPKNRPKVRIPKTPNTVDIETRNPKDFTAVKVPYGIFKRIPLLGLFAPSMTAAPEFSEFDTGPRYWQEEGFEDLAVRQPQFIEAEPVPMPYKVIEPVEMPPVPEVKWDQQPPKGPYITRSPKVGTITYVVPDYIVPQPIPLYVDDLPKEFEDLPLVRQPVPEFITDVKTKPDFDDIPPEEFKQRVRSDVTEEGVEITIQEPKTDTQLETVKIRRIKTRGSRKRRKDTKAASRWIKLAHKTISMTYGTYTEIKEAIEIFAWSAYQIKNGKVYYAMQIEKGNIQNVLKGIRTGKYEVDISTFVFDLAMVQMQDWLIGKASKQITSTLIDQGQWSSPQGPQGFINQIQRTSKIKEIPWHIEE